MDQQEDEETPDDLATHTLSSAAALEMVVESPWGMGRVSPDGIFLWVNEAYLKILGCPGSPSLVIGTHYETWTHKDDIAEDTRQAILVREGKIPGYLCKKRYRVRGPAGRYRWGLLSVTGLWSRVGEFLGYNVQFMPVDDLDLDIKFNWTQIKTIGIWLWANRKTVALVTLTIVSLCSALAGGDWSKVFRLMEKTQELEQSLPPTP